jgi:hypothetical protein
LGNILGRQRAFDSTRQDGFLIDAIPIGVGHSHARVIAAIAIGAGACLHSFVEERTWTFGQSGAAQKIGPRNDGD